MFLEKKNRRASITCWKQKKKKNRFLLDSYANATWLCVNSLVLGLRTGTHKARVRELGLYDPWEGDTVRWLCFPKSRKQESPLQWDQERLGEVKS